ncbi:MAG: hypothetical protein AAGA08_17015 [Pseudomonadota bacterium]
METRNALIKSASIKFDRDMLSAWLDLKYSTSLGQGFGGYVLLTSPDSRHRAAAERGPNYAGIFIDRVMRIAGVQNWSDLPGKTVRVKCTHSSVKAIGHIINDDWFCPSSDFESLEKLEAPE